MRVSHTRSALAVSFDEPKIVGSAALVTLMELARESGLQSLAGRQLIESRKLSGSTFKIASAWA